MTEPADSKCQADPAHTIFGEPCVVVHNGVRWVVCRRCGEDWREAVEEVFEAEIAAAQADAASARARHTLQVLWTRTTRKITKADWDDFLATGKDPRGRSA